MSGPTMGSVGANQPATLPPVTNDQMIQIARE
jgi:hypothetical protein